MPSLLDATLVIQMVHFLCAYLILSKLFLKPAYDLVMKIDAERAALKDAIIQQQNELAIQKNQKFAEFTELQHEMQSRSFAHELKESEYISIQIHPAVLTESAQEEKELIRQVATDLKKRIIHE